MIAVITGAAGLIGSEACRFFAQQNYQVVGIDNDLRAFFFGEHASTASNLKRLKEEIPSLLHYAVDVRDEEQIQRIFSDYGTEISVVVHAAGQPSHDWAAQDPRTDFQVNAVGTLNLLEATRQHCPQASFVLTSTNKVYGDRPNELPFVEQDSRWEIASDHRYHAFGIDESMSLDQTTHSLFGCSKVAADVLVQEYGRYYGIKTGCFRGGCLTGPGHSGAVLHGFLSYLTKCAVTKTLYTIIGHQGKQVRDNIHSRDFVQMLWHFVQQPRAGEVYNAGGGRFSNCSVLEAIAICEELTGHKMEVQSLEEPRKGDHIWYISDTRKFQSQFPGWRLTCDLRMIIQELIEAHTRLL